jgi:hypothetical protein
MATLEKLRADLWSLFESYSSSIFRASRFIKVALCRKIGEMARSGVTPYRLTPQPEGRRTLGLRGALGLGVPMHQPAPIHWSQNPIASAYVRVGCRKDKKTKRVRQEAKCFVHRQGLLVAI